MSPTKGWTFLPRASFADYNVECRICGWSSQAKNALGNAARHARATGHEVSCEISTHVTYNPK